MAWKPDPPVAAGELDDRRRVLLVANTLPPGDVSGVGEQVLQLAAGLDARGHEVEVLGRGPGGAAGPKLLFPLLAVPAVWRALRRFRPDVIQVHESDGALVALLVAVVRRLRRRSARPLLLALLQVSYREEIRSVRELVYGGRVLARPSAVERRFRLFKAPLQVAFGCLTARLADRVLAPSRATAGEIERDYGVGPVEVLPNVTGGLNRGRGIEGGRAPADEGPRDSLLFVGRLRIRKGVEFLLEALALLRDEGVKGRLLIIGDGEHRGTLEERRRELGLGERVEFLGRLSAEEVRAHLHRARALVVPSIYEGMPLVVLEAMEAALPVVASAVSGIPEVVRDGETGWLVPAEDPPALGRALKTVLTDPEEAERRGLAGRMRLEALYRPAVAAELWERLVGGARE